VSERYQREIEDLLRRLDSRPVREPVSSKLARRTATFRAGLHRALRGFLRRAPMEQFMIASIVLVLVSLICNLIPPLALVAYWTSVLSIVFFVLAIGVSVANRRAAGPSGPIWRGQVIDYRSRRNPDFMTRLRQWLRRLR